MFLTPLAEVTPSRLLLNKHSEIKKNNREMPGFLSPLLLLLLPFTYSSAALNHFAKRLIGMQWEESPLPSCPPDSWVFVYVHSYGGVLRRLRVLCPECWTD